MRVHDNPDATLATTSQRCCFVSPLNIATPAILPAPASPHARPKRSARKSTTRPPAKTDLDSLKSVKVGVDALGEILGITPRRIQQLKAEGVMPGARGKYPLVDCTTAYVLYLQKLSDGRAPTDAAGEERSGWQTRKLAAEAETKELEVARLRNILVSREFMRDQWEGALMAIRPQLLAIAPSLAPQLGACETVAEREAMIQKRVDQILETLSRAGDDPVIDADHTETAA